MLDDRDLEDDVLFRLIQDDQNVRVLVTREIESRYLSPEKRESSEPKTQPDLERHSKRDANPDSEPDADQYPSGISRASASRDANSSVEDQSSHDPRRQFDEVPSQFPQDNPPEGWTGDPVTFPPVRPDELPRLLTANTNDRSLNLPERPPQASPLRSEQTPADGFTTNRAHPQDRRSESRANRREREPREPETPVDERGLRRRPNPYADVPSLYDLYSQYPRDRTSRALWRRCLSQRHRQLR